MKFEKTGDWYWDEFGRTPRALVICFWILGILFGVCLVGFVVALGIFLGWW